MVCEPSVDSRQRSEHTRGTLMVAAIGPAEIVILLLYAAIAAIPALIAERKGQSFVGFWALGLVALPAAIVAALIVRDRRQA